MTDGVPPAPRIPPEHPQATPAASVLFSRLAAVSVRAAQRRVMLALIVLAFGAVFVAIDVKLGSVLRQGAVEESRRDMALAASAVAEHLNRALESVDVVSDSLAQSLLASADTPADETILQRAGWVPHLRGWALAGADGVVVSASDEEMIGVAVGGRPWFAVLAGGASQPVLGQPEGGRYLSAAPPAIAEAGRWTIPVIRRLEEPRGEVVGYMLILLNPAYFADIAALSFGSAVSRVRFHGRDGVLLASSRDEIERIGHRNDAAWFLHHVLPQRDRGLHVGQDGAGVEAVAAFQLSESGLVAVEASRDMPDVLRGAEAAMREIRGWGASVLVLSLVGLVLLERLRERAASHELAATRAELDRDHATREAALLHGSREMVEKLHAGLPAIIFTRSVEADRSSRLLYQGGDVLAVTGWPPPLFEDVDRSKDVVEIVPNGPDDYVWAALVNGESSADYRLRQPDGSFRWLETRCRRLSRSADGGGEIVGYTVDVTARKDLEEQIRRLALHDQLTGLPNRRHLLERLDEAIKRQKRHGTWSALIFIDLDQFKMLNDSHGHEAGDEALIEVARRLVANLREVDTVARFAGDEFVVLLEHVGSDARTAEAALQVVLRKLAAYLSEPYVLRRYRPGGGGGTGLHDAGCSLGAVLFPPRAPAPETLLSRADECMYEAKRAGKGQYRYRIMGAAAV